MQTTSDVDTSGAETSRADTPIFQALNQELGELPDFDVHDFDEHAFDFLHEQQESADTSGAAHAQPGQLHEVQEAEETSAESGSRRGGRRRKPE